MSGASDLSSNDVEVDAAPQRASDRFLLSKPFPVSGLEKEMQDRHESGLGNSLVQTSIEESRVPVQCTDYPPSESEVSKQVEIEDEDEGVCSLMSSLTVSSAVSVQPALDDDDDEEEAEDAVFQQDEDGDTYLHLSIIAEAIGVASTLIDMATSPSQLDIMNSLQQTPLHLAVLLKQQLIVRKLVERDVSLHLRDRQGNTPLHIACRDGNLSSVQIMLDFTKLSSSEKCGLLSIKNCEGLTCLHIAMQKRYFDIAKYLMKHNAQVNLGDAKSGRTVLHYMVEQKDMNGLQLLLDHPDINVEAETYKGETPLVIGYWRNYQEIVKKLRAKGAYFAYELFDDLDDENYPEVYT